MGHPKLNVFNEANIHKNYISTGWNRWQIKGGVFIPGDSLIVKHSLFLK